MFTHETRVFHIIRDTTRTPPNASHRHQTRDVCRRPWRGPPAALPLARSAHDAIDQLMGSAAAARGVRLGAASEKAMSVATKVMSILGLQSTISSHEQKSEQPSLRLLHTRARTTQDERPCEPDRQMEASLPRV